MSEVRRMLRLLKGGWGCSGLGPKRRQQTKLWTSSITIVEQTSVLPRSHILIIYDCSAHMVQKIFINPRPACCEIEEGGEGERDTSKKVEVYCPACITCVNPLHLLARQVEGGTRRGLSSNPILSVCAEQSKLWFRVWT